MSDETDILKAIHAADQRSQSEKERDAAIAKCASFTAEYWHEMTERGLPAHFVEALTMDFQQSYLNALYAASYAFLGDMEDDDV